ncbi:MAG: hypothetical protein OEW35_10140 [Gammaproteobacteria bacterium]|nr:hypothetical protein [Gammaproteobacteria bacterium]MDH5310347.1 hypothetical protein [Gammaproteobacteria bacterium]
MSDTMISLLLPPLLLVPAMGMLSRAGGDGELLGELRRKALHVGTGLAALTFPYFLNTPPRVLVAMALVLAWMGAVRRIPALRASFGRCLFGAGRCSHGELYFAVSTGFLLIVADSPLLYAIPLLVLTLADAAAAVAGRMAVRLGDGTLARPWINGKTRAGSAAFALVAFSVSGPLLAFAPDVSIPSALLIGLVLALTTAAVELGSRGGADNFLIPIAAYLVLCAFGPSVVPALGEGTVGEFLNLVAGV